MKTEFRLCFYVEKKAFMKYSPHPEAGEGRIIQGCFCFRRKLNSTKTIRSKDHFYCICCLAFCQSFLKHIIENRFRKHVNIGIFRYLLNDFPPNRSFRKSVIRFKASTGVSLFHLCSKCKNSIEKTEI